jgi:hypothetical protein
MTRSRKVLSLALMGLFALSAFITQGATASPLTVEGISAPGTVFTGGDQDGGTHVFTSAGGGVSCVEASFTGSGAVETGGKVNEQTVTPSYPTEKAAGGNNCTAFGFAGAHIKTNECTYTFTTPAQLLGGSVAWAATDGGSPVPLHVTCPTGKKIEITPTFFGSSVCTQFVGPQTPKGGHVIGKNAGTAEKMDVTLEIALKELSYTGTGSSCGTSGADGTLTGNSTVKCYSDAAHTKQIGCTFS